MEDRVMHGTSHRGEQHPSVKLTADNVDSIRALSGVISQKKIGELYGIDQSWISRIINRKFWSHQQ
jgi:hypothetical protein